MNTAHDAVAAYWAAGEARDWQRFGDLLSEQVVYEAPQSRERVRGRESSVRFNAEGFPGDWHLRVTRVGPAPSGSITRRTDR
ncbi:MAG: nuclear transport factor 2 family protein [Mycobacteriales bacterium]